MKLIDEIHIYQGKFSLAGLHDYIHNLFNRINQSFHQGMRKVPILPLEKGKEPPTNSLIDMRYERRSTIFTTNVNFRAWDEVIRELKLTF